PVQRLPHLGPRGPVPGRQPYARAVCGECARGVLHGARAGPGIQQGVLDWAAAVEDDPRAEGGRAQARSAGQGPRDREFGGTAYVLFAGEDDRGDGSEP
ncbi:hypothetical protein LTR53_020196, partial [Teratosphaeriaceae sp. CCFEE 6253]